MIYPVDVLCNKKYAGCCKHLCLITYTFKESSVKSMQLCTLIINFIKEKNYLIILDIIFNGKFSSAISDI